MQSGVESGTWHLQDHLNTAKVQAWPSTICPTHRNSPLKATKIPKYLNSGRPVSGIPKTWVAPFPTKPLDFSRYPKGHEPHPELCRESTWQLQSHTPSRSAHPYFMAGGLNTCHTAPAVGAEREFGGPCASHFESESLASMNKWEAWKFGSAQNC